MRRVGQACRAVRRRPVVVAVAELGFAGVQPHADPQRRGVDQLLTRERELRLDRGADRVAGGREHGVHAVARRLHDVPAVRADRVVQDRVVAREGDRHRVGLLLPETRRALEVGEEKGDGARRQIGHVRSLVRVSS